MYNTATVTNTAVGDAGKLLEGILEALITRSNSSLFLLY